MKKLLIGLIDSGCHVKDCKGVYFDIQNDELIKRPLKKDIHGHGTVLSQIISEENAHFICAQVYDEELMTTAYTVALAIEYLCEKKVDLIHVSLGLHADREVLRLAIQKALNQGITIVASSPTLSQYKVYPASYEGVIAVCADARCQKTQLSYLNSSHAMFGASPFSHKKEVRGSSVAAAYVTKELARLHHQGIRHLSQQLESIKQSATYKVAQSKLSFNSRGIA